MNCVTVEPGDERGLRDALASLIADRPLAERIGAAARRTVERDFAADAIAARYESLFCRLLDAPRTYL
jgi:glycosyltransferase involved in cell wall biosynthesis